MKTKKHLTNLLSKCEAITTNIQDNGGPVGPVIASGYVTNYLSGITDPTGKGHNFGYLFGLDKVTFFMAQIAAFNSNSPAKPIEGVRVYLGRKAPTGSVVIPMEKIMDTLFLMPVLSDGTDLYTVHGFEATEIILGNPRPCPNECSILSFV
jgi:hypothetical protein